jgi:hypothetical protein
MAGAGISRVKLDSVDAVIRIDLSPPRICLGLLFRTKAGRVIDIPTEDLVAILAVFFRTEDVLVPELVYFEGRRRDGILIPFVSEGVEEASIFQLHLIGFVGAPTVMFDHLESDRAEIKRGYVALCEEFFEHD